MSWSWFLGLFSSQQIETLIINLLRSQGELSYDEIQASLHYKNRPHAIRYSLFRLIYVGTIKTRQGQHAVLYFTALKT